MKLLEVVISNFRQYGGKNEIAISNDRNKNITIIQGVNGAGKSNFMNAVLWCMYGGAILKTYSKGRTILNENCENEMSDGGRVEVSVAAFWGEQEPSLKLERIQTYVKNAGRVSKEPSEDFKVYEITPTGWKRTDFPEFVVDSKLIPKDLVGFFFFDGEKMDEYFRDTSKVKSNVEKISQIDALTSAVETLSKVIGKFDKEVANQAPEGESELLTEQSELSEELEGYKKDRIEIEAETIKIEARLNVIRDQILDNAPKLIEELESKRTSTNNRMKELARDAEQCRKDARDLVFTCVPTVFSASALKATRETINTETERGILPPNVKDTFLKDLLDKKMCICGRDLSEDTEHRETVKRMMNSLVSSEIAEDATKGRFVVSDLLKNMNFERDYLQLVKEQRDLEKRMGKEEESLNSIKSQLAGSNVEQIRSLNAERIELERKHGQLKVRLGTIGSKSVTAEGRIRSINTSIGEADAKDRKRQRAEDARGYARRIKGLMEGIREKIIGDVRSQLEKETENFFFNMIWKKEAFSKMEITDTGTEYKISVKSDRDKECLGDLSAGERQVLALAFTAALYNVSGYDVPVIIDTPLGRISDETSEKIAGSLPGYLSDTQVVLLVTDKEYSEAVRKKLSSHVGKEYVLKYDEKTKCSKVMSNV